MKTKLLHAIAPAVLALMPAAAADDPPPTLPQQAQLIEKVVVPVPAEIFSVLDKIGRPKWAGHLRRDITAAKPRGEAPQVALMLGTLIAEGFIAVEAEDAEHVKNLGRTILDYASALGVRKAAVRRANRIVEFADRKQWAAVRGELDGALADVRSAMIELDSESLAHLISIGGWLRGTEVLCGVVSGDYSRDAAALLRQPLLVDYFLRQLDTLKSRQRAHPLIAKIRKGLGELRAVATTPDSVRISEVSVKDAGAAAAAVVQAIQNRP